MPRYWLWVILLCIWRFSYLERIFMVLFELLILANFPVRTHLLSFQPKYQYGQKSLNSIWFYCLGSLTGQERAKLASGPDNNGGMSVLPSHTKIVWNMPSGNSSFIDYTHPNNYLQICWIHGNFGNWILSTLEGTLLKVTVDLSHLQGSIRLDPSCHTNK